MKAPFSCIFNRSHTSLVHDITCNLKKVCRTKTHPICELSKGGQQAAPVLVGALKTASDVFCSFFVVVLVVLMVNNMDRT